MMGWSGLAASGAQRSGQARGCVRGPSGQECVAMAVAAGAVRLCDMPFSPWRPPGRVSFFLVTEWNKVSNIAKQIIQCNSENQRN